MANHITNIIRVSEKNKKALVGSIFNEKGDVDFNKVAQMPSNLYMGNLGDEEFKKYGDLNWYTWSKNNWGTKWNAYNRGDDWSRETDEGFEVRFYTAWSNCLPVIIALSKKLPEVKIDYLWADEDIGFNVGKATIKNGEILKKKIPVSGGKSAVKMAYEIIEL